MLRLKEVVVQWSEHRPVTLEVAGSSPVNLDLIQLHQMAKGVAFGRQCGGPGPGLKSLIQQGLSNPPHLSLDGQASWGNGRQVG